MAGIEPASPEHMRSICEKGRQRAVEVRRERKAVHEAVEAGELTFSEAITIPVIRHEPVRTLLMRVPHIGRARCREVLQAFSISDSMRISKMGRIREEALVAAVEGYIAYQENEHLRDVRSLVLTAMREGAIHFRDAVDMECVAYEKIGGIVEAVPGIGRKTAIRLLNHAGVSPDRRIAFFTDAMMDSVIHHVEAAEIGYFLRQKIYDRSYSNEEIRREIESITAGELSHDELRNCLYAFLAVCGESRYEQRFNSRFSIEDTQPLGIALPPRTYYPLDVGRDPMVIGRSYRCPDGEMRALMEIRLGKDEKRTELAFEGGAKFQASDFNERKAI